MSGPRPAPPLPAVGNDVVDLTEPRSVGKASDDRFLARVLAPEERQAVRASADQDVALWLRWAAKEAAFKAVTVLRGAPPNFVHAAFVVEDDDGDGEGGGVVRWEDVVLRWRRSGGRGAGGIHVVAWPEGGPAVPVVEGGTSVLAGDGRIPLDRFTERECRALHSPASAWVRLHARAHLAGLAGLAEERIEIVCPEGPPGRTPPRVLTDGRPDRWAVSLSHHGRLLGWVLARHPEEGEDPGEPAAPPLPPLAGGAQSPGGR